MKQKRDDTQSDKIVAYEDYAREFASNGALQSDRDHQTKEKQPSGALLVLIGAIAIIAALIFVLPGFKLTEVEVLGASQVDPALISYYSGLEKGQHLFQGWGGSVSSWLGFRYAEAERNVMNASPYIKTVRVQMDFPSKVKIQVNERVATSYMQLEDAAHILMDQEGYVLDIKEGKAPDGIPMLVGIPVKAAEIGSKINSPSLDSIDFALDLLDSIIRSDRASADSFSLLSCIEEIRVPGGDHSYLKINLLTSDTPIHAKLGDAYSLDDALNWLRYTIRTEKLDDLGAGVLDLSGEEYIFIRDVEEER